MKKFLFFLLTILTSLAVNAQDIAGQWNGGLKIQGTQLRIVLHIRKTDAGYSATMDSPDQGAKGIPVTSVHFEDPILKFAVAAAKIEYEGTLGSDGVITGNFKQGASSFPLSLTKGTPEAEKRPQEPVKPYPYHEEDVTFENKKAGITLAGTLTLPKKEGVFPAVILISGSGPQNRDGELAVYRHKPFLVLSDYLTRNGIAVLRFDDRGTAASTGDFKAATSADFAADAAAGVDYLLKRKEIDKKKIGLIGHSEGGIVAPIVAAGSKDVAFIVLLAGPGIPGDQLLLLQEELIWRASGMSDTAIRETIKNNTALFKIITSSTDNAQLKTDVTNYLELVIKSDSSAANAGQKNLINSQVEIFTNPWMVSFLKTDPTTALMKVKCPVLALNGERDLQVPPQVNMEGIKKALAKGGNKNVTTKVLPRLNHLFQESTTGSPEEYGNIEQTFSPDAMTEVLKWMQLQTK